MMAHELIFEALNSKNTLFIDQIANWYFSEWKTPKETTLSRLTSQPDDDLLFQIVAIKDAQICGTAGLANEVNLLKIYPDYKQYGPWLALMYIKQNSRKTGIGNLLLNEVETKAKEMGLKEIFLYTFTAEKFYAKCGWMVIDQLKYKDHETVIMKKIL